MMKKIILLSAISISFAAMHGMEQNSAQRWREILKKRWSNFKLKQRVKWGYKHDPIKSEKEEKVAIILDHLGYRAARLFWQCNRNYGIDNKPRTFTSKPIFYYTDENPTFPRKLRKPVQITRFFANKPPLENKNPHFVFAGETNESFNSKAMDAIKKNFYITCPRAVKIKIEKNKSDGNQYKLSDVIIAGTHDYTECERFKKQFKEDMIRLEFAYSGPDEHPFYDTPVFDIDNSEKFTFKGSIANVKNKKNNHQFIYRLEKNHIICPFWDPTKKDEVDVIVTYQKREYDPEKICELLLFENLKKLMKQEYEKNEVSEE